MLLDAGADPNAFKEGGYRPLHYAAYNEHADIVKMLLQVGGRVSLCLIVCLCVRVCQVRARPLSVSDSLPPIPPSMAPILC